MKYSFGSVVINNRKHTKFRAAHFNAYNGMVVFCITFGMKRIPRFHGTAYEKISMYHHCGDTPDQIGRCCHDNKCMATNITVNGHVHMQCTHVLVTGFQLNSTELNFQELNFQQNLIVKDTFLYY